MHAPRGTAARARTRERIALGRRRIDAFCLRKTLAGWQARAGPGNSPRTVLEEMARIQCIDVVLPIEDGPEVRRRCVARPDQAQAALLDRLGLQVPERLRVPTAVTGMYCQLSAEIGHDDPLGPTSRS